MSLRSPIGAAHGLGSAKRGMDHHWATILTAVGLVPLSLWFVVSIVHLAGADHATVAAWMGQGWNAALMALTVLTVIYHAVLGVQMVIEDYVHNEAAKWGGLIAIRLLGALMAAGMVVSILKVAFGG